MKDLSVESLNKKGLSDSDSNIRVQLALINWKMKKIKQIKIEELVQKAWEKFKELLKAKRIREGTIAVGNDLHETLSPEVVAPTKTLATIVSDFVSIDLDEEDQKNREMLRKKFGLVSSYNYDQMRKDSPK